MTKPGSRLKAQDAAPGVESSLSNPALVQESRYESLVCRGLVDVGRRTLRPARRPTSTRPRQTSDSYLDSLTRAGFDREDSTPGAASWALSREPDLVIVAGVRFRDELQPMLALAGPVVLAEVGWVMMGIVDTIIVGPLGPAAIGSVGIGSILFLALAIFGMGLLLGLDTLVSHAYGAGRLDECHRWLLHGILLSLIGAPVLTAVALVGILLLPSWGFPPEVLSLTVPYLHVITWSLLPLLLYASFRRYLQALGIVAPITFALVTANLINAVAAWALVYGHLGLPAMGTTGSAVATLISRIYLAAVLLAAVVWYDRQHHISCL